MKTAKDFFEDVKSDKDLAAKVGEELKIKLNGKTDDDAVAAIFSEVAADNGYELTPEDFKEYSEDLSTELTDEELGKVSGGSLAFVLTMAVTMVSIFSATITITDNVDIE